MSKQDELDKLKKLQEHNDKSREGMLKAYNKRNGEINALVAEIADAEKPKLRHGDYGIDEDGTRITIGKTTHKSEYKLTGYCDDGMACGYVFEDRIMSRHNMTWLGNIFDDLKAMQENVTEFEVEDDDYDKIRCYMAGNKMRVAIDEEDGDSCAVDIKDVPLLILKLRQIHATYLRNNKQP